MAWLSWIRLVVPAMFLELVSLQGGHHSKTITRGTWNQIWVSECLLRVYIPFHTFLISSFQLRRLGQDFRPKCRWIPQKTSNLSSSLLLLEVHWLSPMRWLQWWFGCASFCLRRRNVLLVFYLLRRFVPGSSVEWTRRKEYKNSLSSHSTPFQTPKER